MRNLFTKRNGGYITLISTLVVGAVGLSIITTVLLLGLSASRNSFALQQLAQARSLSNSCAEKALEEIRESTSYAGTQTITYGSNYCSYTVVSTGGEGKTITSTGTVGSISNKIEITLSDINPLIIITSWKEVANF